MAEPELITERRGACLIATINRAERGNSLSRSLLQALSDLVTDLGRGDPRAGSPRALVITGNGDRAFSAGADINELNGISPAAAREQMEWGQQIFDRIEQLPIPVIAAINGFALGGGLELAMAADIRIAATHARMGQPEINLANLPGWGGTQRLPRLVGVGRATELIMTGRHIDAQEALAIGLITSISDSALVEALDLGAQLAQRNPTAVAGIKLAIATGVEAGIRAGLRVEAECVGACCDTAEQREAVRNFLDKKGR